MTRRKVDPAVEFISLFSESHPKEAQEQDSYQNNEPELLYEIKKIFHGHWD